MAHHHDFVNVVNSDTLFWISVRNMKTEFTEFNLYKICFVLYYLNSGQWLLTTLWGPVESSDLLRTEV